MAIRAQATFFDEVATGRKVPRVAGTKSKKRTTATQRAGTSPYHGFSKEDWPAVTSELVAKHPISTEHIVEAVLESWEDIFRSKFGKRKFQIGKEIFPTPQVLGNLLHELIPLNLASNDNRWRHAATKQEKDLVFVPDARQSIELKTSSSRGRIFGNRSYGQKHTTDDPTLKGKSGFYLAVNFEKVVRGAKKRAEITLVRFGWLDHSDWCAQKAQSGQAAHVEVSTEKAKLLPLYPRD